MTVVAAYRGVKGSLNALMVDTICSQRDAPAETAFCTDKLTWVYGNTYVTAVGDADILQATRLVTDYLDPKRPNLRDPATIDAILGAVERIWTIRFRAAQAAGGDLKRFGSKGSTLFICNRNEVFYWVCGFDMATMKFQRPKAPHDVPEGKCVIFWGSSRHTVGELEKFLDAMKAEPFNLIATLIMGVDAENRAAGSDHLPYQLDGVFSGVALPHKTSITPMRLRPFASFPEWLVRDSGATLHPLLEDADFMDYMLPPCS
jgi:hypothetical protein